MHEVCVCVDNWTYFNKIVGSYLKNRKELKTKPFESIDR